MTGARVRLGLVGCGRLAEVGYLPAIQQVAGVHLVAVADPDGSRAAWCAAAAAGASGEGVSTFPDARRLVESAEVDAVVVASPVAAHVDDATAAGAAGVRVLLEKPPAPDAATARSLAALSPRPLLGFNRRFDPRVRALRGRLPAEGALDLTLELRYRRASWRARSVQDDALLDLGPHLVDWARWLTGSGVLDVAARELTHERADLSVRLGRGRARLRAVTDRPHREVVEVRDGAGNRLARHRVGGPVAAVSGRLRRGPHPLVAGLAAELEDLARVVGGEEPLGLGTVDDGIAVMTAIDAARASAAAGGATVPVAAVEV